MKNTDATKSGEYAFSEIELSPFLNGMKSFHRETMFLMMEKLKEENIIMPQYLLLRYVGDHGSQGLSSLANFLRVSNPTVTGLTDTLESHGWVTREPDPEDRRGTLVSLTDKSRDLFDRMESRQKEIMINVLEGFDAQKLNDLGNLLSDLASKIRKIVDQKASEKRKR
ncbi:MAG: MarR family transcriptional regulator [Thermoplasmataceae archaeon]